MSVSATGAGAEDPDVRQSHHHPFDVNAAPAHATQAGPVVLGYDPMDAIHAEFFGVIARASDCPDSELAHRLGEVIEHLRAHFEAEESWMRETDFPPKDCHIDEHAAVMRSADEVQALPPDRQIEIGRSFVRELAGWFPGHADYLDSALAAWMCKRSHGGKPIVLHRRSALSRANP
jgi:hemerythrin-like metal-binding protein